MNRTDLQQLAEVRVNEARLLFDEKKFDGAYYLAGYAVEFALKAWGVSQYNRLRGVGRGQFPSGRVQSWV